MRRGHRPETKTFRDLCSKTKISKFHVTGNGDHVPLFRLATYSVGKLRNNSGLPPNSSLPPDEEIGLPFQYDIPERESVVSR